MAQAKQAKGGAGKKGGGRRKDGPTYAVAKEGETKVSPSQEPRLLTRYREEIVPKLKQELGITNPMQVPAIEKIVINCASKDAVGNPKVLDSAANDLSIITGQKAVLTRARKSIANFKVRQGIPLGTRVTLRRARAYEFLDRLVNVALPRVRDFRGINNKAFDGRGNYSLGLKEQIIFPEIDYDKVDTVRGMTVTIQTTATNNEQARSLLTHLGMPFKK